MSDYPENPFKWLADIDDCEVDGESLSPKATRKPSPALRTPDTG